MPFSSIGERTLAFLLAPSSRTLVVDHCTVVPIPLEAKDPDDVVNYVWALGDWLDAEGTTLASYTVAIDAPASPTLVIDSDDDDAVPEDPPEEAAPGRNVCVWLSAGALDTDYIVRLRAVTAAGHTIDRSFVVRIRRR